MARIFTLRLVGAQEAPTPVATAASGAGMIFWDPATVPIGTFAGALTSAPVGSDVALYFNVHSREFPAGEIRGQWVASGSREAGTSGSDTIAAADGGILFAFGRGGDDSLAGGGPANLPDGLADLLANLLDGGGGNDAILGGDAADRIKGGPGDDLLTGRGGRDVFIFRAAQATGTDTVTDFGSDDVVRLAGFAADFDPLVLSALAPKLTA